MSDLIRRSDVLKLPRYNFGTSVSMLTLEEYIKVSDIKKILTAYSVDKVVEELYEKRTEILLSNDYECEIINYCIDNFDKAIEIVKQGGIRKDV